MSINPKSQFIKSYDNTIQSQVNLYEPKNIKELKSIFKTSIKNKKKICFRGKGYSYGDQNFLKNENVISTVKFNKILKYDKTEKIITVECGVILQDILKLIFTDNLYLRSLPGNLEITIGGAVANNVHGKDSLKYGNFSININKINIITSDLKKKTIYKNDLNQFNSIIGSMGLLAFIHEIELELITQEFQELNICRIYFNNYKEFIKNIKKIEKFDFAYGMIDTFATGNNLGRGHFECATKIINLKNRTKKLTLTKENKLFKYLLKIIRKLKIKRFFFKNYYKIFYNLFYFNLIKKNYVQTFFEFNNVHSKIKNFYDLYKNDKKICAGGGV